MKLEPKSFKYKKQQKGKKQNLINKILMLDRLSYGHLGLVTLEPGILTGKQIDTMKQTLNKIVKKSGTFFLYIFPFTPVTSKPLAVRMGKGKGNVSHHISKIKCGTLICEVDTNSNIISMRALKTLQYKLPFNTKIISSY